MKLLNVIDFGSEDFKRISLDCQQFIEESQGQPLVKWCSSSYPDVHRVKVRKRKKRDNFDEVFNQAFDAEYPSVRNRSIIVNDDKKNESDEPFFVFPSDGYKFLYAPNIGHSKRQYGATLEGMRSSLKDDESSLSMLRDILQYSYRQDNLKFAILEKVEIIIYNIPYFYVVRGVTPYNKILEYI